MTSASEKSKKTVGRKKRRTSDNDTGKFAAPRRNKRPADNNESRKVTRARRKQPSDTLRLVLEPLATPVRRRRLGQHVCLDVGRRNRVFGSVNGRRCTVQLDSGSGTSFLFFSLAKVLRLLTGKERTETQVYHLWIGTLEVEVILLDEVLVILEGQVEVRTPLRVLPESLEKYYDPDDLVLGVHVLRRCSAVQIFGRDGSRLHVRRPKCLETRPRRQGKQRRPGAHVFSFWARGTQHDARLMEVLLDTGAEGFFVSRNTGKEIMERWPQVAAAPRGISLDLGGDSCLDAEPLEVIPLQEVDFVMGDALLYQYEAVLDYGRHFLDLTVRGKHFRVNLDAE